jgi:hypothetical protein
MLSSFLFLFFSGDALAARAFISFARRMRSPRGHSFLSHGRKKRIKERPPAASPRLKIERFFLKRANALRFAPFGRARFFTEKSSDFLHASPKRPELYSFYISDLTYSACQPVGKTQRVFPTSYRAGVFIKYSNKSESLQLDWTIGLDNWMEFPYHIIVKTILSAR